MRLISKNINPNFQSIIVGNMLGDGHAQRRHNNTRLTISQKNYYYFRYLYLLYNHYTSSNIIPPLNQQLRFNTTTSPIFNPIHDYFYKGKTKILPQDIHLYLSPLALAI
jgi:hypothetical protein